MSKFIFWAWFFVGITLFSGFCFAESVDYKSDIPYVDFDLGEKIVIQNMYYNNYSGNFTDYYTKLETDTLLLGYLTVESDPVWSGVSGDYYTSSDVDTLLLGYLTAETDAIAMAEFANYYTSAQIDGFGFLTSELDTVWLSEKADYTLLTDLDNASIIRNHNTSWALSAANASGLILNWSVYGDNSSWNEGFADGKYVPRNGLNESINLNNQVVADIGSGSNIGVLKISDVSPTGVDATFLNATNGAGDGGVWIDQLFGVKGISDGDYSPQFLMVDNDLTKIYLNNLDLVTSRVYFMVLNSDVTPADEFKFLFMNNITAPNVCYSDGTQCTSTDNSSWNEGVADGKYVSIVGNTTIDGSLIVTDLTVINYLNASISTVIYNGSFIPVIDNFFTLGNSSNTFSSGHINNVYGNLNGNWNGSINNALLANDSAMLNRFNIEVGQTNDDFTQVRASILTNDTYTLGLAYANDTTTYNNIISYIYNTFFNVSKTKEDNYRIWYSGMQFNVTYNQDVFNNSNNVIRLLDGLFVKIQSNAIVSSYGSNNTIVRDALRFEANSRVTYANTTNNVSTQNVGVYGSVVNRDDVNGSQTVLSFNNGFFGDIIFMGNSTNGTMHVLNVVYGGILDTINHTVSQGSVTNVLFYGDNSSFNIKAGDTNYFLYDGSPYAWVKNETGKATVTIDNGDVCLSTGQCLSTGGSSFTNGSDISVNYIGANSISLGGTTITSWNDVGSGSAASTTNPVIKTQRSDVDNTDNTTWVDSDLSFSVDASKSYTLRCDVLFTGSAANVGQIYNLSSTATTSNVNIMLDTWSSATAKLGFSKTQMNLYINTNTSGSGVAIIKNNVLIADFTTTTSGNVLLKMRSDTNNSLSTLKRGSMCQLWDNTALRAVPILNATDTLPAQKSQRTNIYAPSATVWNATSLGFAVDSGKVYSLRCDLLFNGTGSASYGQNCNLSTTATTSNVNIAYASWSSAVAPADVSATSFGTKLLGGGSGIGVIKTNVLIADFTTTSAGNINVSVNSESATYPTWLLRGSKCELFELG